MKIFNLFVLAGQDVIGTLLTMASIEVKSEALQPKMCLLNLTRLNRLFMLNLLNLYRFTVDCCLWGNCMVIPLELKNAGRSTKSVLFVKLPIYSSLTTWIRRLFWHTHAYTSVFGIMLLTSLSLVLLYGYEAARKFSGTAKTLPGTARGRSLFFQRSSP